MTAVPKLIPGEAGCLVRLSSQTCGDLGPVWHVTLWVGARVYASRTAAPLARPPMLSELLHAFQHDPSWWTELTPAKS